jgi:hypothetical protein
MASRTVGKKSERSKGQDRALEETKVDPAVVRLQATLEENLDFFMNHIGGMIKDLNSKLEATKTACTAAHKQMGVSLQTALLDRGDNTSSPPGSPHRASGGASVVNRGELGDGDADATAAAAAIAAKVKEADDKRKALAAQKAGSGSKAPGDASDAVVDASSAAAGAKAGDDTVADATTTAAKDGEGETVAIVFPDNTLLQEQLNLLKAEAYALGTTFDGIHDWIALNVPDYKEEDNVGVEIMGAVIQQVASLQESIREVYATELRYLEERGDLEKTLLKMPDSDTVQRQMEVLDLDAWDDAERGWRSMIRVSLILFSMLHKNMKVLREPRKQRQNLWM